MLPLEHDDHCDRIPFERSRTFLVWRLSALCSRCQRRAQAAQYAARLAKKEKRQLAPVKIDGRAIAHTF
jgi:hypothetical protein